MEIHEPAWLWLLVLNLPLSLLFVRHHFEGKKSLKILAGVHRFPRLENVYVVKNFFSSLFFILFFSFSVLALADIRMGNRLVEDDRVGSEIVFALDISNSMLARDVKPARLDAAKNRIGVIMDSMPGTRFGLVLFKGKAVRIWPITDDVFSLKLFLDTVDPGLITVPGTDLEDALNTSLDVFQFNSSYRAIVLLTDGDVLSGNVSNAVSRAVDMNVPVLPVPIGTDKGSDILLPDNTFLKDSEGREVKSRADRALLEKIADASKGKIFETSEVGNLKNEFLAILKGIEKENTDKGLRLEREKAAGLFIFLGLMSLVCLIVLRGIKWMQTV
ncbi:MAG: VWA domain-containing protein [Spirochaetales bacterium]|nr:VWA domain-containing protein [Spirochaetales bacterium]